MRRTIPLMFLSLMLLSTACSRGAAPESDAAGVSAVALRQMGQDHVAHEMTSSSGIPAAEYAATRSGRSAEEAMLAYEHEAQVRVDAEAIPARVEAVREACEKATYGACLVLDVNERGGPFPHASLRVRAEAKAIDPLIAAAGKGGEVGDRSTRAEDLSVAVRDNTLRQDRLRKEHARLLEFQGRGDLKVADMIALSGQLSSVEAELAQAEREGAEQKRRIETQLLSIDFSPPGGETGRSEIADAFRESGRVMAGSTAFVIRAISALVPVLLALAFGIWLLRRTWRFLRRRRRVATE